MTIDTYAYVINKYHLNPGRQTAINISNIGRQDLANLFAELKFNLGAEIGVGVGSYSQVLCQANPNLHLFSIDPWDLSAYEAGVDPHDIAILDTQAGFDREHQDAKARLAAYHCTVVRKDSLTAAQDFADNSLDFVYIDANHNFVNVANDLHAWIKKVRWGGILSGHDYEDFPAKKQNHVKSVVQAYMHSYKLLPYFILGVDTPTKPREIRDRVRSWMWIKPSQTGVKS